MVSKVENDGTKMPKQADAKATMYETHKLQV